MDASMRESGKITICMEKESTIGAMAGSTMVNTWMTRSMDLEFMIGQMDEDMKGNGLTANKMEKVDTFNPTEW